VIYKTERHWRYRLNDGDWGSDYSVPKQPNPRPAKPQSQLLAWNPIAQRVVWQVNGGGGVLATAGGLVFQGTASGHLLTYQASNGQLLKDLFVGTGIIAAPMTYAVNGIQFVAVMAGNGHYLHENEVGDYSNRGRILAFRLDGGTPPPPDKVPPESLQTLPAPLQTSAETLKRGEHLFIKHCERCHTGGLDAARSAYPNLFNLSLATHEVFDKIVREGFLSSGGMGSFADLLSDEEVRAIHAWLIDAAYRQHRGESVTLGSDTP
jgi:quinohemoprotein ethanol dehydrogenase